MIIIVMGVSGCGKSTVGRLLADRLDLPFKDADNFHSESSVEKMRTGIPLNDEDRKPWLENLNKNMNQWNRDAGAVLACSALKKSYRNMLRDGFRHSEVAFIFLDGTKKLISERLQKRKDHYMPPGLLSSQFETLEEPENALTISISSNPKDIVEQIISKLSETNPSNY